jgi:hypothetical protein
MGMKSCIEKTKTLTYSFFAGACAGSMFHGFGHLRRLYSGDYKARRKEIDLLKHEDTETLKSRLIIGAMVGAVAGTLLGVALAKSDSCELEEE